MSRLKRKTLLGIYVAYRAVRQLELSHDSSSEHRATQTRNSNQSPCISQDSQPQPQPKWIAGVPIVETVGTFETVREGIHERRRSRGGVPLFNQVGGTLSALLALPPAALPTQRVLGSSLTLIKVALVVFPVYGRRENRLNEASNSI